MGEEFHVWPPLAAAAPQQEPAAVAVPQRKRKHAAAAPPQEGAAGAPPQTGAAGAPPQTGAAAAPPQAGAAGAPPQTGAAAAAPQAARPRQARKSRQLTEAEKEVVSENMRYAAQHYIGDNGHFDKESYERMLNDDVMRDVRQGGNNTHVKPEGSRQHLEVTTMLGYRQFIVSPTNFERVMTCKEHFENDVTVTSTKFAGIPVHPYWGVKNISIPVGSMRILAAKLWPGSTPERTDKYLKQFFMTNGMIVSHENIHTLEETTELSFHLNRWNCNASRLIPKGLSGLWDVVEVSELT
jgi:hypothetical protein